MSRRLDDHEVSPRSAGEAPSEPIDRFRLLVDHVPSLFSVIGRDHRYRYVNLAYAQLFGQSRERIVGARMPEVIGEALYARVVDAIDAGLSGERRQLEVHVPTPAGDRRLLGDVVPHPSPDGSVDEVIVLITDLTVLRRTEDELRAMERRYRILAENATDVIWTCDLDRRLTYVSPSCRDLFGYTDGELLGQPLDFLLTSDSFEATGVILTAKIGDAAGSDPAAWQPVVTELDAVHRSGALVAVRTHAKLVAGEDGAPSFVVGVTHDVTDRRRAEAERESLQAQLFGAQKMEAIGRLAGGIAHDFNNALSVIRSNAEIASEEVEPGSHLAELLTDILSASTHAANLTNQLLTFARKQAVMPRRVSPAEVLQRLTPLLDRVVGDDVVVHLDADAATGIVEVDPVQLEQVVVNLVLNARDAMPHGGEVRIRVRDVVGPEGRPTHVQLVVADQGVGIPEAIRDKIFDPFFTTKEEHGTGLGLSSVRGIVEQNQGTVDFVSHVGGGTEFVVELPVTTEPKSDDSSHPKPLRPEGNETVLVVDDEPTVLTANRRLLRRLGYHVLAADSAERALEVAAHHEGPIHALFTDVVMPGANGYELAARLRREHPGLAVLFTSGYVDNLAEHRESLDEGDRFIAKPFSIDRVARRLREVLDVAREHSAHEDPPASGTD